MPGSALLNSLFFPVTAKKFPVRPAQIPCSVAQGISLQRTETAREFRFKKASKREILQESL